MELSTIGRENQKNYKLPIWYNTAEDFSNIEGSHTRFRVVLVDTGTGIIKNGENRFIFSAPTVFCLNEKEMPILEKSMNLQASALYFHPSVINNKFSFDNIGKGSRELSVSESQDTYWLRPFFIRTESYKGQLDVGPATAKRMRQLLNSVNHETLNQVDNRWPCRSRTYFLELLFLLERLFSSSEMIGTVKIPITPSDMDHILLYLHTHYYRKVTLSELTKEFHINRTTLTEIFCRSTGLPVMTYLIKLRINIASSMLRDTLLPVSEIIERTGFKDAAHFGRMFRKFIGYAPTEYRQNFCWMKK